MAPVHVKVIMGPSMIMDHDPLDGETAEASQNVGKAYIRQNL